jgi:hypothetical protein
MTVDLVAQAEVAGTSHVGSTVKAVHLYGSVNLVAGERITLGLSVCRRSDIGTALPSPNAETDLDWMLWRDVFPSFSGATVDAQTLFEHHSKSQRRLGEINQTLGLSIFNSSAATRTVRLGVRTLLALS